MVWGGVTVAYQPDEELSDEQLYDLIHRSQPIKGVGGCELLDDDDNVTQDLSDYLVGATVTYSADNVVTRTAQIQLEYELDWSAKPRLRLYQTLSGEWQGETLSKRFDRGIYIVTEVPRMRPGQDPMVFDLTALDKCHLLQRYMAVSSQLDPSSGYIAAVETLWDGLITAGMPLGSYLITASTDIEALVTPDYMVWLADEDTRWYKPAADILKAAGMMAPYADEQGRIASRPNDTLATAPIAWTLDTDDEDTSIIVSREKEMSVFMGDVNYRVYIRSNWTGVTPPAEGAGFYTIDDGIDPHVPRLIYLDAADQTTLETLAAQSYAEEKARQASVTLSTVCWPELIHRSVVQVTDRALGGTFRGRVSSATLPLNLEQGNVTITLDLVE